jgi:CDP-paratose 2-epimerase
MRYLIIGGAGFIGSNFAEKLLNDNAEVVILDDLSRAGAQSNLKHLLRKFPKLRFVQADISRDQAILNRLMARTDVVFHLAAQVGVSTSVADPQRDFEINAQGTLNVLEAARASSSPPMVLYASTNKVYGELENIETREDVSRYFFESQNSIAETQPLDFHSPYGCSKGVGDQYVRDYARIYGLKTVVFRQSCIYGPGQFGTEDQGWVAWFSIAAMLGLPVVFYGNGKQTRDLLYVDDLFEAWMAAVKRIDLVAGKVFNIGGGCEHALSLKQLVEHLSKTFGYSIEVFFDRWRPGDQRIYVSDISRAKKELGWEPRVGVAEGTKRLLEWIKQRDTFFRRMFSLQLEAVEFKRSA